MNQFLSAAKRLINRHGCTVVYKEVIEGEYNPSTGTVVNVEKSTTIKAFPKRLRVNQFNYPDLIDKYAVEWLIAASSLTTEPKPQDKVVVSGDTFIVRSCETSVALGVNVLYKVIAVRG